MSISSFSIYCFHIQDVQELMIPISVFPGTRFTWRFRFCECKKRKIINGNIDQLTKVRQSFPVCFLHPYAISLLSTVSDLENPDLGSKGVCGRVFFWWAFHKRKMSMTSNDHYIWFWGSKYSEKLQHGFSAVSFQVRTLHIWGFENDARRKPSRLIS